MKKRILKKQTLAVLLTTTMVSSLFVGIKNVQTQAEIVNTLSDATWVHVHDSYEANDALLANTTVTDITNGFDANISITGWQRCWESQTPPEDAIILDAGWADMPEQLRSSATASVVAGQTYELKLTITNAMTTEAKVASDKNVTIVVDSGIAGDRDNTMINKTVTVPANGSLEINETFTVPESYTIGEVQVKFSYGAYAYSTSLTNAVAAGTVTEEQALAVVAAGYAYAYGTTEDINLTGTLTFDNISLIGEAGDVPTTVVPTTVKPKEYINVLTDTNWNHNHYIWEPEYDAAIANTVVTNTSDGFDADISITGWQRMWASGPSVPSDAIVLEDSWGDNPYQLNSSTIVNVTPGTEYILNMDIANAMTTSSGNPSTKNITITVASGIDGDSDNIFVNDTITVNANGVYNYSNTITIPDDYPLGVVEIQIAYGAYCYSASLTNALNNGTVTYEQAEAVADAGYALAFGTTEETNLTGKLTFSNMEFKYEKVDEVETTTPAETVTVPITTDAETTTVGQETEVPETTTATSGNTSEEGSTEEITNEEEITNIEETSTDEESFTDAETTYRDEVVTTTGTPVTTTVAPSTTVNPTTTVAPSTTVNEASTSSTNKVSKPAQVKIQKIKRKAKSATVTIKKVKTANGYQLKYGANKKLTKNVTTKLVKKTSFTIKALKASKKYYVKVRAYVLDGKKKVFGKWSNVKVIKVIK